MGEGSWWAQIITIDIQKWEVIAGTALEINQVQITLSYNLNNASSYFLLDCYGSLIHACWDASFIKSSPSPSSTIATEGLAWGSKLCAWLFPKHMGILLLLVGSSSSNPGYSMHIEKKSNKLNPLLIHPRLKISLKLKPWKHIKQKLCRR